MVRIARAGPEARVDALGGWELGAVLAETLVGKYALYELAEDGEGRLAALPKLTCAEMNAGVLTPYPGTAHETRRYANEPSIGMIIAGTCFAAELGISIEGTDVMP